jgi:hypothetical protein
MTRRLGSILLAAVTLVVLASAIAMAGGHGDTRGQLRQPQTTPDGFENTLFRIQVFENASARWTIQHSRPLNDSEIDQFETFAADFTSRETATYAAFQTRAENLVRFGRNVTGRNMRARDFSRDAFLSELGQTRGIVEMSFVWTDFARLDGDRVRVGDVFEGGMYVAEGQRLEIRRGPAVTFVEVAPDPDSMTNEESLSDSVSVTWFGEQQFAHQQPSAVLEPRGAETASGGEATAGTAPDGESTDSGSDDLPVLVGGVVLLLVVGSGVAWYAGIRPGGGTTTREYSEASGAADGEAVDTVSSSTTRSEVTGEELLSDEDRVIRLLEENGGRMKQVRIVEETDWSKSKVSMLLSDIEEAGRISKLRVGRENIISIAGEEPDAAGSPFEEDE